MIDMVVVKFSFLFPQFVRKGWKVLANLLSSSGGLQRVCYLPMYYTISLYKWSNYSDSIREIKYPKIIDCTFKPF